MPISLESSDNETFQVEQVIAHMSETIKNMLEDTEEGEDTTVPLPNVNGKTLKKVIAFCEHYKDSGLPTETEIDRQNLDIEGWEADYLNMSQEDLFELILAANYLSIQALLNLTCKKVAAMIKGRSAEEIRELFGIENDFTPEEEEQIRRENTWVEETTVPS